MSSSWQNIKNEDEIVLKGTAEKSGLKNSDCDGLKDSDLFFFTF